MYFSRLFIQFYFIYIFNNFINHMNKAKNGTHNEKYEDNYCICKLKVSINKFYTFIKKFIIG